MDNKFIQRFYIENDESIIKDKYNIVMNNMDLINKLFDEWKQNTQFGSLECNIFVGKPRFPLPPHPVGFLQFLFFNISAVSFFNLFVVLFSKKNFCSFFF